MSISSANTSRNHYQVQQLAETTGLLALHKQFTTTYPYFLSSTASGSANTRYDILFAYPQKCLELKPDGQLYLDQSSIDETDFLTELNKQWQHARQGHSDEQALPFTGGWFIYLGYELASQIEPVLNLPITDSEQPVAFATRIPAAIVHDRALQKIWLVIENDYSYLQPQILQDIEQCLQQKEKPEQPKIKIISEDHDESFLNGVHRIKDYIIEGDIFQVNLSRAWHAELSSQVHAADIFTALSMTNPAPFAGIAQHKQISIISSSPERLVETIGNQVQTRPIAGTHPRDSDKQRDENNSGELLAHPKERAEHIMLIDLERNDLGRICIPGSVHANELMVLESYAHVHHIVSNVQGILKENILPGDVIRAVFPGGTITGCPKVRCMEIIAELERSPRGAYTGSMGFLNHNGNMDLNILIRTMTYQNGYIDFRAGAGIVADSIAEKELDETRAKARGLLLALGAQI